MLAYQQEYISNTQEILVLGRIKDPGGRDFETWYKENRDSEERIRVLREKNLKILNEELFPVLDDLHNASEETLSGLESFADALLDWKTNLDCGICVTIHDALLSLYRVRRDRNNMIRELYKLGMALYFLNRMAMGIEEKYTTAFYFENEMVFTEASAYLRFFEDIDDETTRGYILRSLANIALCVRSTRRKIAATGRMLNIIRDEHYRSLAPGLPWGAFLRSTHQQMSSYRSAIAGKDMSSEEIALVLDSCYEVFKSEKNAANPNVRWLWPYYEMEFTCGYADLKTTVGHLERLIEGTAENTFDMSGMYGNINLPVIYGRMLRKNAQMREDERCLGFLRKAYVRLKNALLAFPLQQFDDSALYSLILIVSDFHEIPDAPSYRELVTIIMQRFMPGLYIRSVKTGEIMRILCSAILKHEPAFFSDLPVKDCAIEDYAFDCGLFHDVGMMKMNVWSIMQKRSLLEKEYQLYTLHTVSGANDLRDRASTRHFADIALGHHSWYDASGGYPAVYSRPDSAYRQMTDVAAVASFMVENSAMDIAQLVKEIMKVERRRFSPLVTACLSDRELQSSLQAVLHGDDRVFYRYVYDSLVGVN